MTRSSSPKRRSAKKFTSKKSASKRKVNRGKSRKGNTKPRRKKRTERKWRRWALLVLLFGGLFASLYLIYLDRTLRVKFEGKRWAVPARVYSRAVELYPGLAMNPKRLVVELKRLGYQPVRHPRRAGAYSRNRDRFLLRTRSFDFPDGREPPRYLELRFSERQLLSIKDESTGRKLPLVRLEPAVIGSIYPAHREDRLLLQRAQLPEPLIQILLAVEDRDFYSHHGVNPKAILRAAWANLRAGRVVQGGSTLTQQLVKNFYLSRERTWWRKFNELLMSLLLEWHYSKDQILEAYANEIYLGQDGGRAIHGFGLASEFYFRRPLDELDLPKMALLVALVRGPSYYNPRRHADRARDRRDLVLRILREQGVIDAKLEQLAMAAPLGVKGDGRRSRGSYPGFLDLVRRQLHRDYRDEDLNSEGLRIFTTMDPQVQDRTGQVLATVLKKLEGRRQLPGNSLEGAVVITSRDDGEVLALVGGRDAGYAGFNRALDALRPIGSLIKPVVYLAALAKPKQYTLITPLQDRRVAVKGGDGKVWRPRNFDLKPHGEVALHQALAHSYNLATVRLGMQLGLDRVAALLRQLGALRPVNVYPSLLLGAASLSVLEVAQIYQTLGAGGFHSPLRTIHAVTDAQGKSLQRYPLTVSQVVPQGAVYLLNRVLQEVVVTGTARKLRSLISPDLGVAGKTGTTDDLRDSWFAGFTGDKVGVVWVGRDDNKPAGLTGSSGAMQVWGALFAGIHPAPLDLLPPASVEFVNIDPDNGQRASGSCPHARLLPFIRGSAPRRESSCGSRAETSNTETFFERYVE